MSKSTHNTPVSSNTRARTSPKSVATLSQTVFDTMTKEERKFIKNGLHQIGDEDPAAYIMFDYDAVEAVCAIINNPQFETQPPDYIMTTPANTAYAFF